MTFPTDDILLGPRSWGKRPATKGVIFHTTEYGGPQRSYAVQCAKDQSKRTANGGWAQPGSYNFLIYDGGVLLTVPYLEASGGINPASAAWAPGRYPWLKQMLGEAAYANPTMYHVQIAFSGRAASLAAGKYPANMIDSAARLLVWIEDSDWGADNQIVSGHLHWQTNRTDPGAGVIDKILARYAELRGKPATKLPDTSAAPPPDPKDDFLFPLRSKAEPWTFHASAKVYAAPSREAPVIYTFGLSGGRGVSLFEQSTYRDGMVATTGAWRGVLLDNDSASRRIGWMHRSDMEPTHEGMPAFDELVHRTLWQTDLSSDPAAVVADLKTKLAAANDRITKKNAAIDAARSI